MSRSLQRWSRRLATIPLYVGLLAGFVTLFPALMPLALLLDLARGQPWTATRTLVFFVWYLACELAGVVASLAIWGRAGVWTEWSRSEFLRRNWALQWWWARMLGRGAFRIFGVTLKQENDQYDFGKRPVLVFIRHSSTADTILAALMISVPHRIRLRYVLKQELLWDPCLDIVGNRIPNVFVGREAADHGPQIEAVAGLARDLAAEDGVLIYPEGTRFSESKKNRIVSRLREQGRLEAASQAQALRHMLPPRPGGSLALLAAAPTADAIFLVHTGFEASASFDRFFNGALVGATIHARMIVVRNEDIPRTEDQRREWLMRQWQSMDGFIERHQPAARVEQRRSAANA